MLVIRHTSLKTIPLLRHPALRVDSIADGTHLGKKAGEGLAMVRLTECKCLGQSGIDAWLARAL